MSYEVVEAGLKAQIEEAISNVRCVLYDYTKVQSGTQKFVVLKYAGFQQTRQASGGYHVINWQIDIEYYCRYTNDADTRNLLREGRQAIIDRINQYSKLDGTDAIFDSLITRGNRLLEVVQLGNVSYLGELLVCQIQEEFDVSYQE